MSVRKLLNYKLFHELGKGGMASVWYAENSVGRPYAIKLLNPQLLELEPTVAERFRNEAQIMVKLNHPAIRRVEDYYEDDHTLAIIMEYLDGQDLNHYIKKNGRVSEEQAVQWYNPVLGALNYVHKKGYFHRDIKPANLFLTNTGEVKVMDFGIAKIVGNDLDLTQTSSMMGSPVYMSPEQILHPKGVDYRTDIYSLGVTLYTLLAGVKPYDEQQLSSFSIQSAIVQNKLQYLAHVSTKTNEVIETATKKNPEERFDSCLSFFNELVSKPQETDEPTIIGLAPKIENTSSPLEKKEQPLIPKNKVQENTATKRKGTKTKDPNLENRSDQKLTDTPKKSVKINLKLAIGIVLALLVVAEIVYLIANDNKAPSNTDTEVSQKEQIGIPNSNSEQINKGLTLFNQQEYDSAFYILNRFQSEDAFRNNPGSLIALGRLYYRGSINALQQPNFVKAKELFEQGIALDIPAAHYYLGLLADGIDLRTSFDPQGNTDEAINHYKKGAESGDSAAQITLASLYLKKHSLLEDEDPCTLLDYLKKATENPENKTAKLLYSDFVMKKLCSP